MVMELEEHERLLVIDGELRHPQPQRAEQLARVAGREVFDDLAAEAQLLLAIELVDERFLRREVAIDGPGADPGLVRDLGHRGAVEAAVDEQLERGVHDRLALGRRLGCRCHHTE